MTRVMSLARALWEANADLARAALEHRLVRGLGGGSLPVESFSRAYALAPARSEDQRGIRDFAELISGIVEELELHEGYAEQWGVSLEGVEPVEATLTYTDFLLATASLGNAGRICAAMTPCMRLYAHLGQSLAEEGYDAHNPYSGWIRTYADPEFEALAAKLEALLDRYATDAPVVRSAYRRAMTLEIAFFEANAGA